MSRTSTILGTGMLAAAMAVHADILHDAIVFARGVSDSSTVDASAYQREAGLLDAALRDARTTGTRLVYFSSAGAVHGSTAEVRDEATPLRPTTDYGRHKVAMEERIRASGARYLIVRFANLVGPRQNRAQLVPSLVRQALDGQVTIQRHASRDLLDVDDAARLVAEVLRRDGDHEVIQVVSGQSTPVGDILTHIASILDTQPSISIVEAGSPQRFDQRRLSARLGSRAEELRTRPVEEVLARHVPGLAAAMGSTDG